MGLIIFAVLGFSSLQIGPPLLFTNLLKLFRNFFSWFHSFPGIFISGAPPAGCLAACDRQGWGRWPSGVSCSEGACPLATGGHLSAQWPRGGEDWAEGEQAEPPCSELDKAPY